ncbi:cation diffusion facilitator family transporter [uncultured Sphingomonas sp.]|uniref:cation diffusion facilitator family transporter n=1 Tax=uncultured Sphingomonas sp. TaxID=158754 RepID=UPI0025E3D3C0|nr:cation diffusion facilitator family transporter [uncultured Sphingomonas sp.]
MPSLTADRPDHHHHHSAPPGPGPIPGRAERAAALVLALTIVTMAAEIAAGWWTGSMALLADGWHMGMHAAAMGVAVFAYRFARHHAASGRYRAGAHKAPDLGAFANAVMLAVVAVLVGGESVMRLVAPEPIAFAPAMVVAAIGLAVNLVSAWLLREAPHAHGCGHDHRDNNREAALVHVLSDALTSALAIIALWCGKRYGLTRMDPLMGLVGAAVILRWSASLLRRTADVLLDASPVPAPASAQPHAGCCGHHH